MRFSMTRKLATVASLATLATFGGCGLGGGFGIFDRIVVVSDLIVDLFSVGGLGLFGLR